jgi:hypothetical protein
MMNGEGFGRKEAVFAESSYTPCNLSVETDENHRIAGVPSEI